MMASLRTLGELCILSALMSIGGGSVALAESTPTAAPLKLQVGELTCEVGRPEEFDLRVAGVSVLSRPQLAIVGPNWSRKYYSFEDDAECLKRRQVDQTSQGVTVRFPLQSPDGTFSGSLQYELRSGGKFRLAAEGVLTTPSVAYVEHRFGKLAPGWVLGREWRAISRDGSTTSGVASVALPPGASASAPIAESFRTLEILGGRTHLEVETSGDLRFALLDWRTSPYNDGELCYWLGVVETPVKAWQAFRYSIEMALTAGRPAGRAIDAATTAPPRRLQRVLEPDAPPDRILPTPKHVLWGRGVLRLPKAVPSVVISEEPRERTALKELLQNSFGEKLASYGSTLELAGRSSEERPLVQIRFSPPPKKPWPDVAALPDFYRLEVSDKEAILEAPTTAGIRAGLATLVQLLGVESDKPALRCCRVEDYAALPVRAVHFFTGKDAGPLQRQMVRDILFPLKFNTLVYQCDYLCWESVPQIHHSRYGMKKSEAALVLGELRKMAFEVIPLVNTFGHSEWLLDNDAFRELADNPERPYAYDPSNPRVYELCDRIYREALDFFRPRFFHIGHDEVTMFGFPMRPANKARGAEQLFYEDVMHYYRLLRQHGVRTMMWGDQLLAPGEGAGATLAASARAAAQLRQRLPKDIVIADWHYDPAKPEDFVSLGILAKSGFDVVACTWFDPLNILRFAKAAADERSSTRSRAEGEVLGLMQTTWAGYSFDRESFESSRDQYAAYVLAAEAAWRGGAIGLEEIPYDYRAEFSRLWDAHTLPAGACSGWVVDLSGVANFKLDGSQRCTPIAGDSHLASFSSLRPGPQKFGRFLVGIPTIGGAPAACVFDGQFLPDGPWLSSLNIPIGRRARALIFALASTIGAPSNVAIAKATVHYRGGTSSTIEWRPSVNVFALEDTRSAPLAPVLWQAQERGKAPRVIHGYVWKNPSPAKEIVRISIESPRQGGALVLFGISGVE